MNVEQQHPRGGRIATTSSGQMVITVCGMIGFLAAGGIAVAQQQVATQPLVQRSSLTGAPRMATGPGGAPFAMPRKPGGAQATPRDFLATYGYLFNVSDPDAQLAELRADHDMLGHVHTVYQQVHAGVPVFGSVLKVHENARGQFLAVNGVVRTIPDKLSTTPALTAARAVQLAKAELGNPAVQVHRSDLVLVDPVWYGDPPAGVHLAYQIELADPDHAVGEAFFVDAHTGQILDRWSTVCTARNRRIYDAEDGSALPGTRARFENEPPVAGLEDVNRAYDYYGDTYDFYKRAFNRDSINGAGLPMTATVYFYHPSFCPNAAWIGDLNQMIFCQGYANDDIVGHELSHGVTEYTAGLIYQNQSGQLNESFSDVMGELVDLFNGDASEPGTPGGTPWPHSGGYVLSADTPNNRRTGPNPLPNLPDGMRWMIGEDDYSGELGGAGRDMWAPESFEDDRGNGPFPARANSLFQQCEWYDNGGVHFGSSVPNHAFAMVVDGTTFNGFTINGIGAIKAGAIWYRAWTAYMTPTSNFEDAYYCLMRAATDLVGSTPNDPRTGQPSNVTFTASDVQELDKALRAAEMNGPGRCGSYPLLDTTVPAPCAGAQVIYSADFDSDAQGWSSSILKQGTNWARRSKLSGARVGSAWFGELSNTDCNSNHSGLGRLTSPTISIPAGAQHPTLRFQQIVQTEDSYDGGNLKISVNGQPFALVPIAAFLHNPYNRYLYTVEQHNTNPNAGEPAFSGYGERWATSVVDLSGIAHGGDTIQIRFETSSDRCSGAIGWYVDDVVITDCPATQDCNSNGLLDSVESTQDAAPRILFRRAPTALQDLDWYPLISDANASQPTTHAERITLLNASDVYGITIWGVYGLGNRPGTDDFSIYIHEDDLYLPGDVILSKTHVPAVRAKVATSAAGLDVYRFDLTFTPPLAIPAGNWWAEIFNNTPNTPDTFCWMISEPTNEPATSYGDGAPSESWDYYEYNLDYLPLLFDLSIEVHGPTLPSDCNANFVPDVCELQADCNHNGTQDICDIAEGTSEDCNSDGVPNECEGDCNNNGVRDGCDIAALTSTDCNHNQLPDECDAMTGAMVDCDSNGIYDGCETDCNHNGRLDSCDLAQGGTDCNSNGVLDSCESTADCNHNNVQDICDIANGIADCDHNGQPDTCQVDTDADGAIDGCDGCALDPFKKLPGQCGCGKVDVDTDQDGFADCVDDCAQDKAKTKPGACGCGVADVDGDSDSVPDCLDKCAGISDGPDADKDGTPDCADECPNDPKRTLAGFCGCGVAEDDFDSDLIPDCVDNCITNPNTDQADSDSDGFGNACDGCVIDFDKQEAGVCGCGAVDVDSDEDGFLDCRDNCPSFANEDQADADSDGAGDPCDGCPNGPLKRAPGICGCDAADDDTDFDSVPNCVDRCRGTVPGAEVDTNGCSANDVETGGGPTRPIDQFADADSDGVIDAFDECPDTTDVAAVDMHGCPVTVVTNPTPTGQPQPGEATMQCGNGLTCGALGAATWTGLMLGFVLLRTRPGRRNGA
jgi:Zn-dependent metalloprotease